MIPRLAAGRLGELARGFPVVAVTGPRQSGKTTLVRAEFGDRPYASLEDPDTREQAQLDPRGFLARFRGGCVLDEIQRAPDLLSYIQGEVDGARAPGRYVVTGSSNFALLASISQSLAGRVATVELLPLSYGEIGGPQLPAAGIDQLLHRGFYPALYDRDVAPADWYRAYVQSYLERDVRQVINVGNLLDFQRFLRLVAARTAQILNLASLAQDAGISQSTARAWLSVLEAGYVIFRLAPYHVNFGKRLVKSPKVYFIDPGLAANLLGIADAGQMSVHFARPALFENLVVVEAIKRRANTGAQYDCYFWRDNLGNEIDLLVESGEGLTAIEIKSGATFQPEWLAGLKTWWRHTAGARRNRPGLVYGGDASFWMNDVAVLGWRDALRMWK
jgi:predicted AAA+ superfamily ATPase